ncbi:MAG: glycosyltransferase family 2 protein [Chloroflexi bacterium]|nr:glycosyltransferase family 2 protein [Chloroflexota bacterium]
MTEAASLSLSVIIPVYNEEARLPDALDEVTAYLDAHYPDAELIIASDGSMDDTESIAREFAGKSPRVRLLSLPHRGKGHAVKQGMLEATGAVRLFMDVDLAVPVELIAPLVEATQNADVVIGSRSIEGAERSGEPLSRRIGGRIVGRATRLILGLSVSDTQCGFKAFRAEAAELLFDGQRVDGFAFDAEILYLARRWGMRVAEMPVTWRYGEMSTVRLHHGPQTLAEIVKIRLRGMPKHIAMLGRRD